MTRNFVIALALLLGTSHLSAVGYVESSAGLIPPTLEGGRTELEMADVNLDGHRSLMPCPPQHRRHLFPVSFFLCARLGACRLRAGLLSDRDRKGLRRRLVAQNAETLFAPADRGKVAHSSGQTSCSRHSSRHSVSAQYRSVMILRWV